MLTDSVDMYRSRVTELREYEGAYDAARADDGYHRLTGQTTEFSEALGDAGRRGVPNLKYFTWVEQQGKTVEELDAQWSPEYWTATQTQVDEIDRLISEFNERVRAV